MPNSRADNSRVPLTRRIQRTWRTTVCAALALLSGALGSAAADAQPAKAPVEVVQTSEGVIELRNHPEPTPSLGANGVQAPAVGGTATGTSPKLSQPSAPDDGVAKLPVAPSGSRPSAPVGDEPAATDARTKPLARLSLGWWALGAAVLATLGGLSALASRRRQQRARRELSAILADSVPLTRAEVETPSFEADSAPPRSTRNGLQPLSERQWLSQPPPSSYKDPTR